jgi:hypothetical protein
VRRLVPLAVALAVLAVAPAGAQAAHRCKPVVNPYPGTRYHGVDLTRIHATGVSCPTARRVARRAHRKGLRLRPPVGGIRRYAWHDWHVTGNLRGDSDRYSATRPGKRVSWRF